MSKDKLVSGQLFLRERGDATVGNDGDERRLFMVIGVVAVPKDCEWKGEHMVPVMSLDNGETLHTIVDDQMDFEEKIPRGFGADQILTGEFWRV